MTRGWYTRFIAAIVVLLVGALALWPSLSEWTKAPAWVHSVFKERISPVLDIRGGLRLMYEVDVEEAIVDRRDRLRESLLERVAGKLGVFDDSEAPTREDMAKARKRVQVDKVGERRLRLRFTKPKDIKVASHDFLKEEFPELREIQTSESSILLAMRESAIEELRQTAIDQTVKTITNRIDELQIRETTVIGRETDLIVEIPGADEAMFDRIRTIISRTARLEFKVVDDEGSMAFLQSVELPEGVSLRTESQPAGPGKPAVTAGYLVAEGDSGRRKLQKLVESLEVPEDHDLGIGRADSGDSQESKKASWRTYYLFHLTDVTGEDVKEAFISYDQQEGNRPFVAVNFNSAGGGRFARLTERNTQRRMAIVLDGRVESAPVIQEKIGGGRARITLGSYGGLNQVMKDAEDLAIVLRAGALPAPIRPANEQLIGPTLGRDSVEKGAQGAMIGVGLVLIFMLFYYQVAGFIADMMVLLNIGLLLAVLSGFGATLTLPGIAGIALTVGMAVDANVLITERIREEVRAGKSPRTAVDQGYKRAVWSILDSQITTFIAGVVLFQYGTGPIKGFAVTLMIGILTSLFTGTFCSKIMLDWVVRGLRVQRLRVG